MEDNWPFWRRYLNLAQPRLGASVVAVTDDFFGAASRLIDPTEPQFIADKYDDHGKWMDGWESRRRRDKEHDFCIVRLGSPAKLFGVDIDTRHFNGNQPEFAVLEGALSKAGASDTELGTEPSTEPDAKDWFELLPRVPLTADSRHRHPLENAPPVNLLRLHILPDGGVARLRAYGIAEHDWQARCTNMDATSIDLGAAENGGFIVQASDEHFGVASNLLLPDRGLHMGDGWETARRRGAGHDWAVVQLGCCGTLEAVEIDTAHFKGNFPHECSLEAGFAQHGLDQPRDWVELLPRTRMQADHQHRYQLAPSKAAEDTIFSHVRLNMFPDGGVSRLRLLGTPLPS